MVSPFKSKQAVRRLDNTTDQKSRNLDELDELYDKLSSYGIMQFVRSGRIAVTKKPMKISEILSKFKTN